MKKFFQFVLAMVISFIPGIIGVMFTPTSSGADTWFMALNKSVLTPDGWVFSVAWTILYFLLGWALYLIISNDKARTPKTKAYTLFFVQMVLNALWSYLFFGLHMTGAALVVILLLIGFSIWMLRVFRGFNKWASYLVWPYIIWLVFATYLNAIVVLWN